jgi:uncharacterized low-complexity protein
MSTKTTLTPVTAALGAVLATTLAGSQMANAAQNPFAMTDLARGYLVAEAAEGNCGGNKAGMAEGNCGGNKAGAMAEGKCGEGRCGARMLDADGDGKVTKAEFDKAHEGMFEKMDANNDGMLDADEMGKMGEGKCGEGKCGGSKK